MSPHLCGDIKIAPCSNIRTRGYPAVFGSITLEPPLVFLPRTGTGRRTRTPTAVKGNAHSRFHTTACRLRNYRTLSASGRFSTSDSPPRLPLNLYCKSAAPCGVATLPLCIFSIAAASRFVNVLINKNTEQCSVKTPNFHRAPVPTPRARGALFTNVKYPNTAPANAPCARGIGDRLRGGAQPEKPPCASVGTQRQLPRISGCSARSFARRRSSRPDPDPWCVTSCLSGIRPLYVGRDEKMHERGP